MNSFENSTPLSKTMYLFVFCLAGLFLAGTLVTAINGFAGGEWMLSPWGLRISSGLQMILMFFMPAITLITWSGNKPVNYLGLDRFNTPPILYLLSIVILFVGMPFISLLLQLNQMIILPEWLSGVEVWMQSLEQSAQETTDLLLQGTSIWDYLGNILFIGIFAAVSEEVFFRGVLQQLLNNLFKNRHAAVWIAAFIFSLMHMQFYGFLPRIILGVMLGYVFLYSKNLWIPILVHFLNNTIVVTTNFIFKENSFIQSLEDPSITLPFIVLGVISLGLLFYFIFLYQAKGREIV